MNILIRKFLVTLRLDDNTVLTMMKKQVGGSGTMWTTGKAYPVLAVVDHAGIPNFMLADDNGLIRVIDIGWCRFVGSDEEPNRSWDLAVPGSEGATVETKTPVVNIAKKK